MSDPSFDHIDFGDDTIPEVEQVTRGMMFDFLEILDNRKRLKEERKSLERS